tara:strand:+ start:213 stop:1127 length:915 start_codon:yes stop_codon:yes gene_type:complete
MNPFNQTKLYGHNNKLLELINLYKNDKLPNKILFSGQKGIGKSTLALHLINYILSVDEEFSYDVKNCSINESNRTFRLIQNKSNPNFFFINIDVQKKFIDIEKIRNLMKNLNKSSLNNKPRFVFIDNIELLNIYSINALLKVLEEPTKNTFFILVNNNKKILSTLKSRCLDFKIGLSNENVAYVCNKLFNINIDHYFNKELLDYYITPGKIYNLYKFSKDHDVDLRNLDLKNLLILIISEGFYKKDILLKIMTFDLIELYLLKKTSLIQNNVFNYLLNKISNTRRYNLDEDSLLLEVERKLLNG